VDNAGVLDIVDSSGSGDIKENAKISGGGGLVSASATGKCEFTTYFAEHKYDDTKCADTTGTVNPDCCVPTAG